MAIIRQRREKNYSIISNDILDDQRMSFKARGLLAYMLSKSDDWKFYVDELANHSEQDGKKAVQSALKEIENAGYLKRIKQRDKQGHFSEQDWQLLDVPTFSPQPPKRQTAKRQTAKRQTANGPLPRTDSTKNLNNQELNKESSSKGAPDIFTEYQMTGATLSNNNMLVLMDYEQRLGDELVLHAIAYMDEHATKPNFNYLRQMLDGYETGNVNTVEKAEKIEKAWIEKDKARSSGYQRSTGRASTASQPKQDLGW